jgi:hypothetical protein
VVGTHISVTIFSSIIVIFLWLEQDLSTDVAPPNEEASVKPRLDEEAQYDDASAQR